MPSAPVPVFVIDDHAPFRAAARAMVEGADGFTFAGEAGSGEEALVIIPTIRPAMVLMDVRLPGMDGIEATRLLLDTLPATIVVLCSTYQPSDLPDAAATCGAVDFVRKEDLAPSLLRFLWDGRPGD